MHEIEIGANFPLFQLAKAFQTESATADPAVNARMRTKIRKWHQVLLNMQEGNVQIGSRKPLDVPEWVTPEVLTGGFVSGNLLAAGILQEHEIQLLQKMQISPEDPKARLYLNSFFLSDEGMTYLKTLLASGCYRIQVPEEGALLTVAWFIANDQSVKAEEILEVISPFFDRLRFYPIPADIQTGSSDEIYIRSVGDLSKQLAAYAPSQNVLRQYETVSVWLPLYDEVVSHYLEAIQDSHPSVQCNDNGSLRVDGGGRFILENMPVFTFEKPWCDKLQNLLQKYNRLTSEHKLCKKPHRKNSGLSQLLRFSAVLSDAEFAGAEGLLSRIALVLARFVSRHGPPGSEKHQRIRRNQAQQISGMLYQDIAKLIILRLKNMDQSGGLEEYPKFLEEIKTPGLQSLPKGFIRKIKLSMAGPVHELIKEGVITSGDTLAVVLPQITSSILASGFHREDLRRLHSSLYQAFRRRRSLLLLNLESQVKINEVPWINRLDSQRIAKPDIIRTAQEALTEVITYTLTSFPYAIVPNKLLQEVRTLSKAAKLDMPLVDELAADIFMGTFSKKFSGAAVIAAKLLDGTLYQKYYEIDFNEIINPASDMHRGKRFRFPFRTPGKSTQDDSFANICLRRSGAASASWSPANNGKIIEQQQILTTQNLAALFYFLKLDQRLTTQLQKMARDCFIWICNRQQIKIDDYHATLVMAKNTAYAWRQLIFYLSMIPKPEQDAFLSWMQTYFEGQSEGFRIRFRPAVVGLIDAHAGISPNIHGRQFLGWSEKKHWILSK